MSHARWITTDIYIYDPANKPNGWVHCENCCIDMQSHSEAILHVYIAHKLKGENIGSAILSLHTCERNELRTGVEQGKPEETLPASQET